MPEASHRHQPVPPRVRSAELDGGAQVGHPVDQPFPARPRTAERTGCRRLQSADLMGPDTEIEIQHGDALYRLRLTSLGKLILTK
jgi:hemin uptake protein HemP